MSPHGTNARYSRGCHCEACCTAHRDYAREYRMGLFRTVDAAPIRKWLRSQPWDVTMADIAERTGVHPQTLRVIRSGRVERTNVKVFKTLEPWIKKQV